MDGKEDGGVADRALEPEETAEVVNGLAGQEGYITGLADTLYSEDGSTVSDSQAALKPAMWFNMSVYPFYEMGKLSADRNGLYEWIMGPTEKHCKDCSRLSGQKHRLKHWHAKGWLPKSEKLDCSGFQCECQLKKTTGKSEGSF